MIAVSLLRRSIRDAARSQKRCFSSFPSSRTSLSARRSIPGVNHIVAVASGKGGVGKSTTAINIATALANCLGLRVGLLDADVYGPSVPRMLGISGKPEVNEGELGSSGTPNSSTAISAARTFRPSASQSSLLPPAPPADGQLVPAQRWGLRAMSMGLLMAEEEAAVWRGPMVMSALDTFFQRVCWAAYDEPPLDVLILDMPPGTGDAQLQVSQRLQLDGAVIVTTPQDIALLDARRGCTMFRKVNCRILGIVENMSFFVCGNCGHEAHVFGSGGAARVATETGSEVLGQIPLVTEIRETSDLGTPIVVKDPESAPARAYISVAERVWAQLQAQDDEKRSGGPRVVVE